MINTNEVKALSMISNPLVVANQDDKELVYIQKINNDNEYCLLTRIELNTPMGFVETHLFYNRIIK